MTFEKHLFMLGAGFMQKPAIETAKKLGWHVTAVDGNPHAVCASLSDEFIHIDLKDIFALEKCALEIKKTRGIDAVFTAGTDFSASVSYLAEKLELSGHSYEAALNATDKVRMRSCFAAQGVASPKSAEFDEKKLALLKKPTAQLSEYINFFSGFPLVVKPVDNMGARGCRLAGSLSELIVGIHDAISYSRSGRAIVEEYMDGPEFSIDALVYDGKIIVCGFADRHIYYPPYFIEMGHTMSAENSEIERNSLLFTFEKGVRSLGLTCGSAKGDIKLTSKGPMIGEIAARLSGGYMSGWTFPLASGLNLTEQALFIAAGKKPPLFSSKPPVKILTVSDTLSYVEPAGYSAERAWVSIPGVAKTITGYDKAEKTPLVCHIFPRVKEGDKTVFPVNNVEKCGNIISSATTRNAAICAAEEAARSIVVRLEPHNEATENFLAATTDFPPSAYIIEKSDSEKLTNLDNSVRIDFSKPLDDQLPDFLRTYLDGQADWNRKTMRYALEQFSALCEQNRTANAAVFWRAFIRGGLQGALYITDM